jgi:predicted transcriptional regulator
MLPDISNLKRKRLLAGLTQQSLAKISGVSQSMIAKIESGLLDPTLSKARKISAALVLNQSHTQVAKDLMSKVTSFPPEKILSEAITCMQEKGFSQFPVVKHNQILGLVSERSILAHSLAKKVKDVMVSSPPLVDISTPVSLIKNLLTNYSSILVIQNGSLVGIITPSDILKIR